jgi:cytochrome c5
MSLVDRCARRLLATGLLASLLGLGGCGGAPLVQWMANQPKVKPLAASTFFSDGRSARPLVEGTTARGHLRLDDHLYTGKVDGKLVNSLPFPVTAKLLERGHERFNITCAPCHDRAGTGDGMVVRRGYRKPPSFHLDRLRREVPLGHFFDVMTNGFAAMPDYSGQLTPEDRWAIVAYIRALQLSQDARAADVPPELLQRRRSSQ